jgi:hypothetical protein
MNGGYNPPSRGRNASSYGEAPAALGRAGGVPLVEPGGGAVRVVERRFEAKETIYICGTRTGVSTFWPRVWSRSTRSTGDTRRLS